MRYRDFGRVLAAVLTMAAALLAPRVAWGGESCEEKCAARARDCDSDCFLSHGGKPSEGECHRKCDKAEAKCKAKCPAASLAGICEEDCGNVDRSPSACAGAWERDVARVPPLEANRRYEWCAGALAGAEGPRCGKPPRPPCQPPPRPPRARM